MTKQQRAKKLHIGCGNKILKGYVNTDFVMHGGVDHTLDINKRFPFKDNTFDEVLAIHILEHSKDLFFTMGEIWRVLKPTGILIAELPYYHTNAIANIDHRYHFDLHSLNPFLKRTHPNYYKYGKEKGTYPTGYTDKLFVMKHAKLNPTSLGRLIPPIPLKMRFIIDLRHLISHLVGDVLESITFELAPVKDEKT
ncbi:MAG: methyltransferase domain-containing protein [Nanoarchaeota archaeon]